MNFNLTFRIKIILSLLLTAVLSFGVIGFMGYNTGTNALKDSAFHQLTSIREAKRKSIETYFNAVREQVRVMSGEPNVVDAMKEFGAAFNDLENLVVRTDMTEMEQEVRKHYDQIIVPKINERSLKPATIDDYLPNDKRVTYLHYHYLAQNELPDETRHRFVPSQDASSYGVAYAKYHNTLDNYLSAFRVRSVYLLDHRRGHVLYASRNMPDLGTSLLDGPYRQTNLSQAFREAIQSDDRNFVKMTDFMLYDADNLQPAAFIAAPVYDGENKIGVLAFQLSTEEINSIMTGDRNWKKDGLGESGETYIVAQDYKMRSISRFLIEDKENYFKLIEQMGYPGAEVRRIRSLESSIMLQTVKTKATLAALNEAEGLDIVDDYRGVPVLSAYSPLNIKDVKWVICSEIDEAEAFAPSQQLRNRMLAVGSIILMMVILLAYIIANSIARPIQEVQRSVNSLAKGVPPPVIKAKDVKDEIGEMIESVNRLTSRFLETAEFAQQIGKQNLSASLDVLDEKDLMGNALLQMRDNLKIVSDEERVRSWQNQGVAMLNEELRAIDDLGEILRRTLAKLVDFLQGLQGGVYLVRKDEQTRQDFFYLVSQVGFGEDRLQSTRLPIDHGLLGRVYASHQQICINNLNEAYYNIGLPNTQASPKAVLVVPMLLNDAVMGVIELTSLTEFNPASATMVERIAAAMASAIFVHETNQQTRILLEESRKMNEALMTQEEELRQNAEELQATNEEINRRAQEILMAKQELEDKNLRMVKAQEDLQAKNEEIMHTQRELELRNEQMVAAQEELRKAMLALKDNEANLELQVQERTKELERAKHEADRANHVKSAFLANMSHELRTPLNGILGYAQLLLNSPDMPKPHKDKIKIINKSGEHLLGLINEVLDLSKIEAGKMELQFGEINMPSFLREVFDILRIRALDKGLSMDLELDKSLPTIVMADEGKLRQCLINLLGNAIKFTQEGGVTLASELDRGGKFVRFSVIDTGRGIPKEMITEIVKPFQQVTNQINTEGGTGLGLAITKSYIELMGGQLNIESELGQGSVFSFTLPLTPPDPKSEGMVKATKTAQTLTQAATKQAAPAPQKEQVFREVLKVDQPNPPRILIVDDNEVNREVATEALERVGFITSTASDGKQGVEAFQSFSPDLILMDIKMPVMDGIEATQTIRKLSGGSDVRIIALTASVFEQERETFIKAGCDSYLGKPYKFNQLFAAIGEVIAVKYQYADESQATSPSSASPAYTNHNDDEEELTPQSFNYKVLREKLGVEFISSFEENFDYGDYGAIANSLNEMPNGSPELVKFREYIDSQINNLQYQTLEIVLNKLKS